MALYRFCSIIMLTAGLVPAVSGVAGAAVTDWVGDSHAAVRLITATDSVAADSTLEAGLEFRFAKGWHGYWRTPGDAGVAPLIDWSGSENIARHDIAWPAPHRLVIEDLQNIVYDNHVVLPVKLSLEKPGAPARILISLAYAACSEICVPYQADLALQLPPGAGGTSPEAAAINAARKTVPGTAAAAGIDIIGTRVAGPASEPVLVVDLLSKDRPFMQPDLFIEGIGNGIPAAPKIELQANANAARLTVRMSQVPPSDRPLTLTMTDQDRAAEFQVNAGSKQ
jgi:suppressor for copper-sensitivity B